MASDTQIIASDDSLKEPLVCNTPRPIVIIYGGMHKTGTSSVQNTLYDNRHLLNRFGIEIVDLV